MKKCLIFLWLIFALVLEGRAQNQSQTFAFRWSAPTSLTPAFAAPDSNNRYGDFVSNTEFTAGPVRLVVNDDAVPVQEQKARFMYVFNTATVELRVYYDSFITVSVPEGESIREIRFEGPKVSDVQLAYEGDKGTLSGDTWSASPGASVDEVVFSVQATINCTLTSVRTATSGAENIVFQETTEEQWFNLQGIRLPAPPTSPGVYIQRNGSRTCRIYKKLY